MSDARRALVTGGLGFIGSHLAAALLRRGWSVRVLDTKERDGWREAEQRLRDLGAEIWGATRGGVRDRWETERAVADMDVIFHLAAQVAVTRSVEFPIQDFADNALGTLHVLEAARRSGRSPAVLYASTNKVYGALDLPDDLVQMAGVDETHPVRPLSPYGCSKASADQYVQDYAQSYGLRTAVLRMSCIYGPGQHGTADQGWLAWFAIAAATGQPITICGDGEQRRDLLHVTDCVGAWIRAESYLADQDVGTSLVLNLGGGPGQTLSLNEALALLDQDMDRPLTITRTAPRIGDQRIYVSDITRAKCLLGWEPRIGIQQGLADIMRWAAQHIGEGQRGGVQ